MPPRKRKAADPDREPDVVDLMDSDDPESPAPPHAARRNSARIQRQQPQPPEKVLCIYPENNKEGITLTYGEWYRLQPLGESVSSEQLLLNDTLVDFYIKHLLSAVLSEEEQRRVHIFSSFFFKRLKAAIGNEAAMRGMLKWVQKVDLLSKQLIFVRTCRPPAVPSHPPRPAPWRRCRAHVRSLPASPGAGARGAPRRPLVARRRLLPAPRRHCAAIRSARCAGCARAEQRRCGRRAVGAGVGASVGVGDGDGDGVDVGGLRAQAA